MSRDRGRKFAGVLLCAIIAACGSDIGDSPRETEGGVSAYAQGYGLVHWQADRLKNIDKLLIVKLERDVIREITKEVAALSGKVAADLEAFAATHEGIVLDREYLPPIEAEARNRMGMNIAGELLFSTGCDFEQRLLFTEAIAVLRMAAIAEEMREEAPDEEQKQLWAGIAEESDAVFERVRGLINRCEE